VDEKHRQLKHSNQVFLDRKFLSDDFMEDPCVEEEQDWEIIDFKKIPETAKLPNSCSNVRSSFFRSSVSLRRRRGRLEIAKRGERGGGKCRFRGFFLRVQFLR